MRYGNNILALGFILLLLIPVLPANILAQTALPVPTSDKPLEDKEAGLTIFGVTIQGLTWDLIVITAANIALEEILNATTKWVNDGFDGNPAYATDPEQFFTNIADNVAGEFIFGSDLGFLCSPFQAKIRIALNQYHAQRRTYQCSLSQVVGNLEGFYSDFSQGGWDGWFSMTQNDVNNPYGAFLTAQADLDSRVAKAVGLQDKQLSWSGGFLSWSECRDSYKETRAWQDTGECPANQRGPTKTPGKVIESQLNNNLGSGVRKLEIADEFDELISALAIQLVKQVLSSGKGLFDDPADDPPPLPVFLSVSKSGDGSGTITSDRGGINCGTACSDTYGPGTSVTLTAIPAAGSIFTGWPGACFGTGTCVVGMNTDRSVLATFSLSTTLTVVKSGTGAGTVTSFPAGINCGTVCQGVFAANTSMILTASPAPGSSFTLWSGGNCADRTARTCVVNMSTDRNVTAQFTQ